VFGKILSADGNRIAIQGQDNVEQSVLITTSTVIRIGNYEAKIGDLKADQNVSVFGRPNDQGQIEAKLIRIMDSRAK